MDKLSPAIFEKTIRLSNLSTVFSAGLSLFLVLGVVTYFYGFVASANPVFALFAWIIFLAFAVLGFALISRAKIFKVTSDSESLVIFWANGKVQTIPWSEVKHVRTETTFPIQTWVVPVCGPVATLQISTNKDTIILDELFAWDKVFVENMTKHPSLKQINKE